jgi:hypothetical protein
MKRKWLAIGSVLLFIGTACSFVVLGNTTKDVDPFYSMTLTMKGTGTPSRHPFIFEWGVDQKNIQDSGWGISLFPPQGYAQSFTPTKEKLTAVSLCLVRGIAPPDPVNITVSIRENLTGVDLASKTIRTSEVTIKKSRTWVLFDFEDISLIPEITYYIVCSADAGNVSHAYCWVFADNDTYFRGNAWFQENENSSWIKEPTNVFHIMDFCFKTYFRKPLEGTTAKNSVLLQHHRFFWTGDLHRVSMISGEYQ